MPKVLQTSFAAGELAETLASRIDLAKYRVGAKELTNFLVHRHGGVSNRAGTYFVSRAPAISPPSTDVTGVRLIPFQYNVEQAYVLEFTHKSMRVLRNGALVLNPLCDSTRYQWTASSGGTSEYYLEAAGGGQPTDIIYPDDVLEDSSVMTAGTLSSLTPGQWAFGDADTLGFDTIYVRLSDNTDPDTKADDFVETPLTVVTPFDEANLKELRFTQSADVMFISETGTNGHLVTITRSEHYLWTVGTIVWKTGPVGTVNPTATYSTTPGSNTRTMKYKVTCVGEDGVEGFEGNTASETVDSAWPAGEYVTVSWTANANASYYKVYKSSRGEWGLMGTTEDLSFIDDNINPNIDYSAPEDAFVIPTVGPHPLAIHEQRLFIGGGPNEPMQIYGTRLGTLDNLMYHRLLVDDDALAFSLATIQANGINHIVPMDKLIVFTSGAAWTVDGGSQADAISPLSVNADLQEVSGSSSVRPIVVRDTVLFVSRDGKIVRDLRYTFESDKYGGSDLTVLANHLFEDRTIVDWAYEEYPDSVLWCVMDDGVLLSLTYMREHELWAWTQHETDGKCLSVCTIPTDDGLYLAVDRPLTTGQTICIEHMKPRVDSPIEDAFFVDCGLSYDGSNSTSAYYLTLSGGSTWKAGESLTLTATGGHAPFSAPLVGRYYKLTSGDDEALVRVASYTSSTVVTVVAERIVPTSLQATATNAWALTATTLSGLDHLEGLSVVALADGSSVAAQTVSGGSVVMPSPSAKVHVGLAFTARIVSLDLDAASQEHPPSFGLTKTIREVVLRLSESRGAWVGSAADDLVEVPWRDDEDWGEPTDVFTGDRSVRINTNTDEEARVYVEQRDPLPLTVLGFAAEVDVAD